MFWKLRLVLRLLSKVPTEEIEQIYTNYDEGALALGRFELFKSTRALDFMIGLDSDNEQRLFQLFTPKNAHGQLTGSQLLKREKEIEGACQEMLENNINVEEFLQQFQYKVVPKSDA